MEVNCIFNGPGTTFAENDPRPPVPGEENELTSNGGTSTKSSGSHMSQISHQSNRSHSSSNKSISKGELPPAATPRRSNLDRTKYDGSEAPLGFEPEGSAASSPPFQESTPPYLKWAENINNLLEDSDGANLYKQYLTQNHVVDPLQFWYACKGLKLVPEDDHKKIQSVVKTIYRRYIKSNQLQLNTDIRRAITDKLKTEINTQSAFDEAQLEVEKLMAKETYLLFLKSDLYVQYVQNGGESPKTSNNSSGSSSVRPLSSGPLPTVPEGEELKEEDINTTVNNKTTLPLTPSSLLATRNIRANYSQNSFKKPVDGFYPSKNTSISSSSVPRHHKGLPSPYHTTDVSYAPVSAQDSEIGSLSSDALTDDTMSLTDSSVDGREPVFGSKKWYKKQTVIRNNANLNKITGLPSQQLIPRPDRGGKQSNLAETDPKKFSELLISKLEKVQEEKLKMDRLHENLQNMETTDEESDMNQSVRVQAPNTSINLLMQAMQDKDDNAQSILEDHVSRIWDNSSGQTPSRSPGHQSPSPDRSRSFVHGPNPNVSGISLHPKSMSAVKNGHKRKDNARPANYSGTKDGDKSMFCESESHKHIHHIHHHHHHITKDPSKRGAQPSSQDRSLPYNMPYVGTPARNISDSVLWDEKGGKSKSKPPSKRSDSQSSAIDSGVSDVTNIIPITHQHDKVMSWMMENDKIQTGTAQYSTDNSDKCSSQRKSHKSGTSSTHNKSSSSGKKQSTSFDVGYDGPVVQPSQPFVQDPLMPIPNPPNPMVQLEEAKRRLEDESRSRISKSKSYNSGMGGGSKERHAQPPPLPPRTSIPAATGKNIPPSCAPLDLSYSDDYNKSFVSSIKPDRINRQKQAVPQSDVTVVGYYFCSEPIPYRSTLTGRDITLAQFKTLITKRGSFKFFFKTASNEFGTAVVYEEVKSDEDILPLYEGKIIGKVEKQE